MSLIFERPLLLDGAMGTALGCPTHSPAASLDRAGEVRTIHRSFVEAGAQVVLTNTFAGSAPTPAECEASLRLARRAGATYVAASLWAGLAPRELAQAARALSSADAIWLETATNASQAFAALKAVKGLGKVVVTFAFLAEQIDQKILQRLVAEGASAVGFNCSPWARQPGALASLAASLADLPLVLKPDAVGMAPVEWALEVAAAADAGARFVGGCCGATAAHLLALKAELDRRALAQTLPKPPHER